MPAGRAATGGQDDPGRQPDRLETRILTLRGVRVMLDADLAALYGVTTKALVQAVKRNRPRFPDDFIFQLEPCESLDLRSHL